MVLLFEVLKQLGLAGRLIRALIFFTFFFGGAPVIAAAGPDSSYTANDKSGPIITSRDSANSLKALKNDINNLLSQKMFNKTAAGLAVYSLTRKKFIYQKNISKELTPASNTKLVTTFTALAGMGADYKLSSCVYTDGEIHDTVLKGNLFLVGRGDPLLSVADIEFLADQIGAAGIKIIEGDVYADDSFFDNKTDRKKYSGDKDRVENLPPITALSLERNTATVLINSGAKTGVLVDVRIIPASEAFITSNSAKVKSYKKTGAIREPAPPEDYFEPPDGCIISKYGGPEPAPKRRRSSRTIKISSKQIKDDRQRFTISGYLYPKKSYSYRFFMNKPGLAAAGALKNHLQSAGILVCGEIKAKTLAEASAGKIFRPLAKFDRNLLDIIYPVNKDSDNYLAENLYKTIGAYAGNFKENALEARKVELKVMENLGIPSKGCKLYDGSGLSRRNRITPESIISILIIAPKMPFGNAFDSTLSIAGIDGTLEKRMAGTAAEANLRAKTGTLRNVSALSGYVNTLDGEPLAFSFIFNGPYVGFYKQVEDRLGELLAQFFYYNEEY